MPDEGLPISANRRTADPNYADTRASLIYNGPGKEQTSSACITGVVANMGVPIVASFMVEQPNTGGSYSINYYHIWTICLK